MNCAGIWIPGDTLITCSDQHWDEVIDTNLKGTYLCCQAAGKVMMSQKSGSIINLSSQVGLTPGAGTGAYSISKAAIIMLTRQLALELAPYRIRVNAIAPGWIETDMTAPVRSTPMNDEILGRTPAGRWGQPEEVAGTAVYLASRASDFVTGTTIRVDGGYAIR